MKNVLLVLVASLPWILGFNPSNAAVKGNVAKSYGIKLQFVDRDCKDFSSHKQAQKFYVAAGGPVRDPHHLDQDRDGKACEMLP